jgi:hypothetical protein
MSQAASLPIQNQSLSEYEVRKSNDHRFKNNKVDGHSDDEKLPVCDSTSEEIQMP